MKKLVSCLLFCCLCLSLLTLFVGAKTVSGSAVQSEDPFYDNHPVQYTLDTDSGELRIFSTAPAEMLLYPATSWIPWLTPAFADEIETVIIEDGIKSIGRYAFFGCENLKTVYIPDSVEKIDAAVFFGCTKLEKICYQGTQTDFVERVKYDDSRNYIEEEGSRIEALSLFAYGESVTVLCQNQEGHVFDSYRVSGYGKGEEFVITPKNYEGLSYAGKKAEIKNKFREGDTREFVLEYTCAHAFAVTDPKKPCGSFCTHCGALDPEKVDAHTWQEHGEQSERGLFSALSINRECTVCGGAEKASAPAYIWYVLAVLIGLVVIAGVVFAILIPIKKRKKIEELTW